MTYACPVFVHAIAKELYKLQVVQNKLCTDATDAHWCVKNSVLHRDLELPTLAHFMKNVSKRFFDIAGSHPDALLRSAVSYEPPSSLHLVRRTRSALTDPHDALTAEEESLMEDNDSMTD